MKLGKTLGSIEIVKTEYYNIRKRGNSLHIPLKGKASKSPLSK